MNKKFKLFALALFINIACAKPASNYQTIIESGTPETLSTIQQSVKQQQISQQAIGDILNWVTLQLLGKPYVPALLDKPDTPEYMYVSLNATDCMLFVEHVLAVAELIKKNELNLNNLIGLIKKERYHGQLKYSNRNHYFKDWALENQAKGLVTDQAMKLTGENLPYDAHVLGDVIAKNPQGFHYADLSAIRQREQLINQQKLGFIPLAQLPKYLSAIENGDIIGIVRTPAGRADSIHHLAIANIHNGEVGMVHASSTAKKVIVADSLMQYLNSFSDSQGIILLRAK